MTCYYDVILKYLFNLLLFAQNFDLNSQQIFVHTNLNFSDISRQQAWVK